MGVAPRWRLWSLYISNGSAWIFVSPHLIEWPPSEPLVREHSDTLAVVLQASACVFASVHVGMSVYQIALSTSEPLKPRLNFSMFLLVHRSVAFILKVTFPV